MNPNNFDRYGDSAFGGLIFAAVIVIIYILAEIFT